MLARDDLVDAPIASISGAKDERATADHVDPAGVHDRQRGPLLVGHGEQHRRNRVDGAAATVAPWMRPGS